jgi:isopropylmalate/homocitrate/citramalate synthase
MALPPLPARVTIVEVGPRDGLQNEPRPIGLDDKIRFVDDLSAAGLPLIEVAAFVNPARVPQMADATDVVRGITRRRGTRYSALVPNLKGLEPAVETGVDEVAIFAAATETFSQRNIGRSIEDSLRTYAEVCQAARRAGLPVRGYLSTCFGCPFEGDVPVARVVALAARLADLGVYQVVLSDTIGVAHPRQIDEVVEAAAGVVAHRQLALHLHDTRGTALANILAGLSAGITTFDASAGGLGGCPFAPGATGNAATEDVLYMLHGLGIETGVSLEKVVEASARIEPVVGHALSSRCYRAMAETREL